MDDVVKKFQDMVEGREEATLNIRYSNGVWQGSAIFMGNNMRGTLTYSTSDVNLAAMLNQIGTMIDAS